MPSNITADNIDNNYPIAGQDNDSQGFRDNFNLIKNSLVAAKSEIEDLQDNTAKLNVDNNYNGVLISNARFENYTDTVYSYGAITNDLEVDWEYAPYQLIQANDDITITLSNWPDSSKHAKLKLQLTGDGSARTLTFQIAAGGTLKTGPDWPGSFTVTSINDPVFVEFWTVNAGVTVFGRYLGLYDV